MQTFHKRGVAGAIAATLLVTACQTTNPQTATVVAQPDTPVVKNITSFSNALQCMDALFLAYGKRDIVITSDGLPDATGQIAAGTKDMMITALSKMSERSSAFRFTDIEQGGAVDFIQSRLGRPFDLPNFYIRGAITQVDRNVATDAQSAGVALPFASLGYSQDQMLSVVTIDMNIGDLVKRQIIPGLHTTNTITIVSRGKGADTEGIIQKASLFFEMSQDRSQGTHQSVRTLVELGLIEVLGKLTKVPYWRCLEMDSTDPAVIAQARGWYDEMAEPDRLRAISGALQSAGYYGGPTTEVMTPTLRDAVNRFKAGNDLIANGRIDFDLYYKLLVDNRAVAPPTPAGAASSVQKAAYPPPKVSGQAAPAQSGGEDPIGLTLQPANGRAASYRQGDNLVFRVGVQRDADVYCYYEFVDEQGNYRVARVFPNRWQPRNQLRAGESVMVPGQKADFQITLQETGVEEGMACVAVGQPYGPGAMPAAVREGDLKPLTSVRRLFQAIDQHQQVDHLNTSVQTVRWKVR